MHEGFVPKGLDESSLALQCRGEGAKEMSVPTGTIEKLSPVLHWLASRVQATIDLSYLNLAWLPHQRHSQRGQKYPRRLRSSLALVLSSNWPT